MRITKASKEAIRYACMHFHYAKSVPVNPIGYNVYNDKNEWCGVILYAYGANKNLGTQYNLPLGGVLELVRVALNGKQEQTSKALALTIKCIKKDVPMCQLIVSYADCDQDHLGTIYQATNWIYTGETTSGNRGGFMIHGKKTHPKSIYTRMVMIDGKKQHCPQTLEMVKKFFDPNATEFITKGKRCYLMPLKKGLRESLMHLNKPYPKNDGYIKKAREDYKL